MFIYAKSPFGIPLEMLKPGDAFVFPDKSGKHELDVHMRVDTGILAAPCINLTVGLPVHVSKQVVVYPVIVPGIKARIMNEQQWYAYCNERDGTNIKVKEVDAKRDTKRVVRYCAECGEESTTIDGGGLCEGCRAIVNMKQALERGQVANRQLLGTLHSELDRIKQEKESEEYKASLNTGDDDEDEDIVLIEDEEDGDND